MNTIYFDPPIDDAVRRKRLYGGQIIAYSPVPSAVAFCEFAREMLQQAFAPLDPRDAQYSMTPEEYAAILADLKPRFIHHPRSKEFIGGILRELGCDLEKVFFDVPRMRSATSDGYLTSGIAYAFHPHRDTWYSAPFSQINWWMPIYEVESENAMAFHPRYWSQPVRNGSREYDYYEWNATSRPTYPDRYPAAAECGGTARTGSADPDHLPARLPHALLGSTDALDGPQYVRTNPVQHRFQDGPHR
jgi:hypothetical protein